jgi:hypothetical protein
MPGGEPSRDPRAAFAELSNIMLGEQQLSQTLARVAELAKQAIPRAADVSITLLHDSEVATVVFTGPLASQLDERQYEAGFGPCVDAALSGTTIAIEDTADSPTYSDFGRLASRHGITQALEHRSAGRGRAGPQLWRDPAADQDVHGHPPFTALRRPGCFTSTTPEPRA